MSATTDDLIVDALKAKYFSLIRLENYPHTPETTVKLNNLEQAIRQLAPPTNIIKLNEIHL